ncbi:MAG: hypothetical protein Wins2KO_15390 [Winogradskyella sp.]
MGKKIGVVITDGVGYRNFVMSDFLNEASKKFSEVILYSGLPISTFNLQGYDNITLRELEVFKEPRNTWFLRRLKEIAHLFKNKRDNFGISDTLSFNKPKGFTKRSVLNRLVYVLTYFFHSEKNIITYEKWQFLSFAKNKVAKSYLKHFDKDKPDLLFFTHQRPSYLAPVLAAAQKLEIPTTTFIFSWDNLASKGRMLGEFDKYLVWSELMKEELLQFYPRTNAENIHVVGTPQFEPYVLKRYEVDKIEFFGKFNLDINKKVICYSCADSSIGKNDETHIRSLWNYISQHDDLQLLIRTSPAEDGGRFQRLKKDIPQLRWNIPKWIQTRKEHAESWSQRLPTKEDIIDLKAILTFAHVNVNMLSTMSLDFMLFDKPVVNTVFGNDVNGLYNDQRFLNYKHYKHVVDSNAVTIAKNEKELHKHLDEALNQPSLRTDYRKEILQLEIGEKLEGTSARLVKALMV